MAAIRLQSPVFATELLRPISENLDRHVTVTAFELLDRAGNAALSFEVRVKKIGTVPVPRNTKPGAALG